jgi:hypothetical protein
MVCNNCSRPLFLQEKLNRNLVLPVYEEVQGKLERSEFAYFIINPLRVLGIITYDLHNTFKWHQRCNYHNFALSKLTKIQP